MNRGCSNAYAQYLGFQYNNFGDVFSIVNRWPLLMNFSILHYGNFFFLNVPHLLWVWDFVDIYLIHLGTRKNHGCMHHQVQSRHGCTIYAYLKKLFFELENIVVFLLALRKKSILSTLNFMILQMVRNEWVKFGRHVDIQVNYKILQLKVPNNAQTLHNPPCFR